MQTTGLPDPIIVTRQAELEKLARILGGEAIVAVDTEANSMYAYREQVCLIQFSTGQADYLVDPLALDDLSPLHPLFANPNIEKVFHAAEYDLILMQREFGFEFANLFDTMIAARVLGVKAIGLGAILEAEFGIQLNKKYQRANWGKRPLPADMVAYARFDTHYLIPLRERMRTALQATDRWPLAVEDFERACHVRQPDLDKNGSNCWRINGSRELEPQRVAILQELCAYRDRVARTLDRPLFKVLGDNTILAIAENNPQSLKDLEKIPGMTPKQIRWHGREMLAAVRRGAQAAPPSMPKSPRPDEQYLIRLDKLRLWRKRTARKMDVESDVVLPRDLLFTLASENPRDSASLEKIMAGTPWRLKKFGAEIKQLLHVRE